MITVETRPLEDSERRELSQLLSASEKRERGEPMLAAAGTFIVVGGVALLAWPWDRGFPSLVPVLLALAVGFAVFRRMRAYQARSEPTSALRTQLDEDLAHVTTYEVVDAIRVEEAGDEGSQYFLKLRDGRILFVGGQHVYEFEEDDRFPNTKFQVVRTARTGHLLAFHCLGAHLPPSSQRPPFVGADYRSGRVPEDGALWEGNFDVLREDRAS